MEAARVAAQRGHDVTLAEKANKLGGQINLACVPPYKQELSRMIKYLSHQVKKEGVKVELGKEVTAEGVESSEHAAYLRDHGIDLLQGFAISKAIDAPTIFKQLKNKEQQVYRLDNYGLTYSI